MKNTNMKPESKFYSCDDFESSSIKELIESIANHQIESGENHFQVNELIITDKNGNEKVLTRGKKFEDFKQRLEWRINELFEEMQVEYFQDEDGVWLPKYSEAETYGVYQSDFI